MESLKGKILVASNSLIDPNFKKSVIAICEHTEHGILGLVLNIFFETKDRLDVLMAWKNQFGDQDIVDTMYLGGPLPGGLVMLHTDSKIGANREITPGLYYTRDRKEISKILKRGHCSNRCFFGYSGWQRGQLKQEIDFGSWIVLPSAINVVFHEEEDLWKKVLSDFGEKVMFKDVKIIPPKIEMN